MALGEGDTVAILGGGSIGRALGQGWVAAGVLAPDQIAITRSRAPLLHELTGHGFRAGTDNAAAVRGASIAILAVQPQQLTGLLDEIGPELDPSRHVVVSVVSGVTTAELLGSIGSPVPLVRAMPNTAVAIRESMTCVAAADGHDAALELVLPLFEALGRTLVIPEGLMESATALCACGIAFFLRSVRAASQGGIEIGFHPEEALLLAAQTARGAASLLLSHGAHPEAEIDRVTTPRGCTIAGLNEMEHRGFSSAMIKAILVSAAKAGRLYEEG